MPFEQHHEKSYPHDVFSVYQAALKAAEKLQGRVVASDPQQFRLQAKFPKVILGKTLGERTHLSCEVRPHSALGVSADGAAGQGAQGSLVVIEAYPLDALERKLLFGARKGVTLTVVTWFMAHLDQNLGKLAE